MLFYYLRKNQKASNQKKMNPMNHNLIHLLWSIIWHNSSYTKNTRMKTSQNSKTATILLEVLSIRIFFLLMKIYVLFYFDLESNNFSDIIKDFYDVNTN